MPGPLQVIAVSFSPGSDFQARVLAEVDRLQGRGVLRLLDVIFVAKNEDGTIEPVVVGGDDDDLGALLSSILPLGGGGLVEPTGDVGSSGFALADAWALAESLLPGTALALLLVEHGWAQALFDAVAESGGALLGEGFLTAEAGLVVGAEVAALEEAAEVIAVAQAAEARATLAATGGRDPGSRRDRGFRGDRRRCGRCRGSSVDRRRHSAGGRRPRGR